jgi:5-methylcytosine-specific restriction endonuclease McrA
MAESVRHTLLVDREPNEDWLRAVNFEVLVPRVIRLLVYDRFPRRSIRLSRRAVFARDEHRCQYCSRRLPSAKLSLDHVVPRSRGGDTSWENAVCACPKCNVKKCGRTPQEARVQLGRKPYRPIRSPLLTVKLANPKYESWKTWLGAAYCEVGV